MIGTVTFNESVQNAITIPELAGLLLLDMGLLGLGYVRSKRSVRSVNTSVETLVARPPVHCVLALSP